MIAALREDLMAPDAVRKFVAEFTKEWNRLAAECNSADILRARRCNAG
ncbi:MAG TPA: hypothetical protein VNC39_09945 [Acidocella sp.]|jgi:hypothetical protein|nr:hypothetical protein [Acidocella sp.]HVE22289.1 hypothetical protein [Acidocella sp.]